MPFYDFKCPVCNHIDTVMLSMDDIEGHVVLCKRHRQDGFTYMNRNYQSEHVSASMDSHTPHISDSLAIHPDQIQEHKRLYPDVGVLPDGRIKLDSPKIHDRYLKARGITKRPQPQKAIDTLFAKKRQTTL